IVFSQLGDALTIVPLDGGRSVTIDLGGGPPPALSAQALRGRHIFYRSDDPRITADGMACSSCHPDGTEDGLTWSTPDGPRQTPMLAGRLEGTQPFGWTREQPTLEEYVEETCRRLGGTGLSKSELSDVAAYLLQMRRPPRARVADEDLAMRGKAIFVQRG